LIDEEGHICLADFGLAKYITSESHHAMTFAGTPMYVAPEMIESHVYGREIDWWALGVIMYLLYHIFLFLGTRCCLGQCLFIQPIRIYYLV